MAILRWAAIGATVGTLWAATATADDSPAETVLQPISEEADLSVEEVPDSGLRCPGLETGWRKFELGGWLDQGVTINPDAPADRSNLPAGYNDRSNDYQLNQLWLYLDRPADNGGCGWALGGRVDLMYGTDGRYFTSVGLEDDWNDAGGHHRLAMPQLYMEVAANGLTIKLGHFWAPFGYERPAAPDNFFYSHAISFVTAQPRTFTGLLASCPITDRWSIRAGFHRGWDQWEDVNEDLGFVGGLNWTSASGRTTASFVISTGREGRRTLSSLDAWELIVTHRVTDRLLYVIEHQNTQEELQLNCFPMPVLSVDLGQYAVNQHVIYQINDRWSAGMRFEWFNAFGVLEFLDSRRACNANHYALTWGVNWQAASDLVVRPELRWNWSDGLYYDEDTDHDQVLLAMDLLWRF